MSDPKRNLHRFFWVFTLLFSILWIGLVYWQVLRFDLAKHPANPRTYTMYSAKRGSILDRKGRPLAASQEVGNVFHRVYGNPLSLSHVIGYFHPRFGMTRLEKSLHTSLARGHDILLTIDWQIQQVAQDQLGDSVGAIVVLQPKTGQVLALVSTPFLDANNLATNWLAYLEDESSPFLNRATHGLYPPGSVIKPLLLAAGYQEDVVRANTVFSDSGSITFDSQTIRNFGNKSLGRITAEEALALSANVFFADLAVRLGPRVQEYYRKFSLGTPWDLGIQSNAGNIPSTKQSPFGFAQLGIGQGELLVTPLQMAVAIATIANGGVRMEPYLVREIQGSWLGPRIHRPQAHRQVVSQYTAALVRHAMLLAVEQGTAKAAKIHNVQVAGKTGTAQNPHGADHSWFVGFAPATAPQFAIAVLVEHGGLGSLRATPMAKQVLQKALDGMEERLIP